MSDLPALPKIADIGTSTGVFLRRVGELMPWAEMHGFDVSDALFPPSDENAASSTQYSVMDIKRPIPEEFKGVFDVVHVRLLVWSMTERDWPIVVVNLHAMLKPGGWLQWEENDLNSMRLLRDPGCAHPLAHSNQFNNPDFQSLMGTKLRKGWYKLPDLLATLNMTCLVRDMVSSDRVPETRQILSIMEVDGFYEENVTVNGIPRFPSIEYRDAA